MPPPPPSRPTLSIVVPVYNVAEYLPGCIESIQRQSIDGVEIVAVDDGSTDDCATVLTDLATREPRLRVVTQDNQGLGAARNTGVNHATGEFLWFVDSDDRLAPGAITTMLSTITATGSDLATGNVSRLIGDELSPARFLAETFARTRLRTHIRRFPLLINDRVAWNKIYRRSFWDHHGFRFPTGVHYEDQYVTLPAHYLAKQVDVRREPVYLWRVREDADAASITQQRTDPQSMQDRIKAVAYVSEFLAGHGRRRDKLRYDTSAVTHDLRYFLAVFDTADPTYRDAFLTAANNYLAGVDPQAFARLPSLHRLQWELVRRGDADRVAELVDFEHHGLTGSRAVRSGRRWYAEFPGRNDPSLALSDEHFAVRRELRLTSTISSLEVDATSVRVRGHAAIDLIGDVARRVRLLALPQGRGRAHSFQIVLAPDGDYSAELPLDRLAAAARRGDGDREWRLILLARDHGLRRVAAWHEAGISATSAGRIVVMADEAVEVRLALTGRGRLTLAATTRPMAVSQLSLDDDVLELAGQTTRPLAAPHLVVAGPSPIDPLPVHVESQRYLARLPLRPFLAGGGSRRIEIESGGVRSGLAYSGDDLTATVAAANITVGQGADGYLTLTIGERAAG